MSRRRALLLLCAGCVSTASVGTTLTRVGEAVDAVPERAARACAPADLARAQAFVELARLEGRQGRPARAAEHLERADLALAQIDKAIGPCLDADEPQPPPVDLPCTVPPDYAGPLGPDGCPLADADGDGVADRRDFCPDNPEDLDGWEDEDGCPDPDNDLDGIPDIDDACPNEPGDPTSQGCPILDRDGDGVADAADRCPDAAETVNAYLDGDGCPDVAPAGLRIEGDRVNLLEPVTFEPEGTAIDGGLGPLQDLARLLDEAPDLVVELHVHTDALLSADRAMTLSEDRGRALVAHLVSLGVTPGRVRAVGFGSERPIDTNRTEAGRRRNRRVEVVILSGLP